MDDQQITNMINSSLIEEFELDPDDMTPEAHIFDELGLDSLDIVDMVVMLETLFKFKIRDEESVRTIRTLGDIHTFIINTKNSLET